MTEARTTGRDASYDTLHPSAHVPDRRSAILHALRAATDAHPTDRKRLIGPDVNYGRELLIALARSTGGWVGWEATNLRGIAEDLAFVALAERDLRAGSDIEIGSLVNRALNRAIDGKRVSPRFDTLARSLGFRRALLDALLELRIAGVAADDVRRSTEPASPAHDLASVLDEYEQLLSRSGLADVAAIFQMSLERFEDEARYVLDGHIFLTPSLSVRGLPGLLVERLIEHGAQLLGVDPVFGEAVPAHCAGGRARDAMHEAADDGRAESRCSMLAWLSAFDLPSADDHRLDPACARVDLFAAASPSHELREVCRRIVMDGHRWDEVEIVATDVDTYGIALDALCQQLGIGATMLHGVSLARTRLGRALDRWLAWLGDGLPADVLRQAFEAGELNAPGSDMVPTALARELRAEQIGWGRARYDAALARLRSTAGTDTLVRRDDESDDELAVRVAARRRSRSALAELLGALLACTPPVPERGDDRSIRTSCAALARATLGWLALVPLYGMPEQQTALRLRTRLEELSGVDDEDVGFASALAALRDALSDLRAWPLLTADRKPWSAAGGMLHLTDIAHAGATDRRRIFVVGLDADRAGGAGRQDPLLPDAVRRAISDTMHVPGTLATSAERRDEAAYALTAALASLRGRVTLSYATSGSVDGRESGPSAVLLQAWRLVHSDRTLSYESLRDGLRPPVAAVPARREDGALATQLLDSRDVWLDALADGALLLDGDPLVREAFAGLDAGLRAMALASGRELTAYHGLVRRAAGVLDPTVPPGTELSPSSLEKLAACPLAWFYRYGLKLYLPDDPEYDAERWLDALDRGSLLHEVFEAFTRAYQGRQREIEDDAARIHLLTIVAGAIARWRETVPPPGETVFEREAEEIRRAALAFLQMERDVLARGDRGRWSYFEYAFGRDEPPGRYTLPDGTTLLLMGRTDRIDEMPGQSLRVVDYKTGRATPYRKNPKGAAFNGGRQLQPALYAAAVGELLGAPVGNVEYRFPTERGENEIVAYDAQELEGARHIVGDLMQYVREGAFIPTTDSHDCAYCDHQAICRVRHGEFYAIESPRARWAEEHAASLDVYESMLQRRGGGNGDGGTA